MQLTKIRNVLSEELAQGCGHQVRCFFDNQMAGRQRLAADMGYALMPDAELISLGEDGHAIAIRIGRSAQCVSQTS
jgi:hypothetical protein